MYPLLQALQASKAHVVSGPTSHSFCLIRSQIKKNGSILVEIHTHLIMEHSLCYTHGTLIQMELHTTCSLYELLISCFSTQEAISTYLTYKGKPASLIGF